MTKKKNPTIVTPVGVLSYSHLKDPDTKGKYADGKYKADLVFDPTDDTWAAFEKKLTDMCHEAVKAAFPKLKNLKGVRLPFKDGNDKKDKETGEVREEFADKIIITAKSKYQPGLVDATRAPLPEGVFPFGGDIVKAQLEVVQYGETAAKAACTVYLKNMQLLEKRSGGFQNPEDVEWGEEEGYEGIDASQYQPRHDVSDDDDDDDLDDGAAF